MTHQSWVKHEYPPLGLRQSEQWQRVILRLAVYRQSVRLGVKHIQTHDQRFSFSTELLW
jgi:hypothetical protein